MSWHKLLLPTSRWYSLDTEFWETHEGAKVSYEPISLAIVGHDARKLYLINSEFNWDICDDKWLLENVFPHIKAADSALKMPITAMKERIIHFFQPAARTAILGKEYEFDRVVFNAIMGGYRPALLSLKDRGCGYVDWYNSLHLRNYAKDMGFENPVPKLSPSDAHGAESDAWHEYQVVSEALKFLQDKSL